MADESIFSLEGDEPAVQDQGQEPEEPTEDEPVATSPEEQEPEDPEERYKFWQRKYDKAQEEQKELAEKAEKLEQYGTLYDYASQYEQEFLDFLDNKLQGGQAAGTPRQAGDLTSPNGLSANGHSQDSPGQAEDPFAVLDEPIPERPKRPDDRFDEQAMEAYYAKQDAYEEAMDRRVRAQNEIVRMQREQARQQEAQRQAIRQQMSYVQRLGASAEEAQAFLQDYLDPKKQAELDKQLLAAWRAKNGSAPEPKKPPVDPSRLEEHRKGRADGPAPPSSVPGKAENRTESIFATAEAPRSIW